MTLQSGRNSKVGGVRPCYPHDRAAPSQCLYMKSGESAVSASAAELTPESLWILRHPEDLEDKEVPNYWLSVIGTRSAASSLLVCVCSDRCVRPR